jgi:hypothetical protein
MYPSLDCSRCLYPLEYGLLSVQAADVGALAVQSLPVSIHVVSARHTCQPMARLRHIAA